MAILKTFRLGNFLCCGCIALVAACATRHDSRFSRADVYSPDFFPILPWDPYHGWDTPHLEPADSQMKSVADCHFNLAPLVQPKDLPLCRKLGLGAIVLPTDPTFTNVQFIYQWKHLSDAEIDHRVKSMVESAGNNPAAIGFFITDEPGTADFPALGKAMAAVRKYAPGRMGYINLFPDYATLGAPDTSQLGAATYAEYLERFVAEVKPQFISYDNYMVQYSMDLRDRATASSYYHNMLEVRRVAMEHHLPYLIAAASCQLLKGKPIPTPANLLFQAYTSMAAGYRGVTWYTYFGMYYPYAPLTKSGDKSPTWTALQDVNLQLEMLAPILSHLTSTGVYFSAPAPADNLPLLPGKLVASVACANPLMIGEFEGEHGEHYAMIVNLSIEHSAAFTMKTAAPVKSIRAISAIDGSSTPFTAAEGMWLTPGAGVLLSFR